MNDLLVAIVLGIVEGATEFIPVSSTGHLILVSHWLGFSGPQATVFAVVIQLGAILAILWLYRSTVIGTVTGWRKDPLVRRFGLNVVIGTIPAALIGFLAADFITTHLFGPVTVAWALIVGGIAIFLIEWWQPPTRGTGVQGISPRMALAIGLAQVLALFPGVSRSAATIMGGYGLGLSRVAATEFSFFLAVPIMLGAAGYELSGAWRSTTAADLRVLAVGFMTSFLSAIAVVKALLRFVSGHSFRAFAWYRVVLGVCLLAVHGML